MDYNGIGTDEAAADDTPIVPDYDIFLNQARYHAEQSSLWRKEVSRLEDAVNLARINADVHSNASEAIHNICDAMEKEMVRHKEYVHRNSPTAAEELRPMPTQFRAMG